MSVKPIRWALCSTLFALVLALSACGGDEATSTAPESTGEPAGPLAPDSIGPVAIGASEDDVRSAFGEPSEIDEVNFGGGDAPQVDWTYELSGGSLDLHFETATGELRQYSVSTPSLETEEGIGLGSTKDEVEAAYGGDVVPAPLGDGLILAAGEPGTEPALVFNFSAEKVAGITGGDLFQPAGE